VVDVEMWAELRREHFVRGVPIKELARRTGLARNTIRSALRSERPPRYRRSSRPSKLDPFKEEIHRLLTADHRLPGVRIRELLEPLGFNGGKSIVDDYLREVRPLFAPKRTFQRTVYRPGEICQFDVWQPSRGDAGRPRRTPHRLRRGRLSWLLARRRRRADLQQGGSGRALGDQALSVIAGRVAQDAGLGSRGVPSRTFWAPRGGVRGVLRPST
jgi:hypothetical protein